MDYQLWIAFLGLVTANALAVWKLLHQRHNEKRAKRQNKQHETVEEALVPLRYFKQIQTGQSEYIKSLETRIDHHEAKIAQCEADKERMQKQLDDCLQQIRILQEK